MSTASKPSKTPCPKCGNPLRLAGLPVGEQVRCPKCEAPIVIGGSKPTATKPAATKPAAPKPAAAKPAIKPTVPPVAKSVDPPSAQPAPPIAVPLATVVDPTAEPPKVVAVNPFTDRMPGELPIARPVSVSDNFDDDDAYEPEIPLIPSTIVPQEPIIDANLGNFDELRREVRVPGDDAPEVILPNESPVDHSDLYFESARKRGLVRYYYTPDPPRWTFFSGVFGYPWRGANLSRWAAMSFGLGVSLALCIKTIELLSTWDGDLLGLLMIVGAVIVSLLTSAFVTPACQVAIQDTADGHDLAQDSSMPEWDQWMMTTLSWLMLGAASAALGYPLSLAIGPSAFLISLWLLFPVLLLGSMETNSVVMPVSVPVLQSLLRCGHLWLMFYLVATPVFGGAIIAAESLYPKFPGTVLLLGGPVLAAVLLIYSRLLGRLAWRISGAAVAPIEVDSEEEAESLASDKGRRKKRTSVRILVPDELPPAELNASAPPPPRLNFHHRD
jgi:hypothetical protein